MKRIVIKVGSHILTSGEALADDRINNLVAFLVDLSRKHEVLLVSSGAVAAGYTKLKIDKSILGNRQAIAAVGQPYLMSVYEKKFRLFNKLSAQILLSASDFDSRKSTAHAKCTIDTLLSHGVIPIINENDATDIAELVFGDNDQMSAHVAYYFDADLLVILSDIDGYYDKDPRSCSDAKMLKVVESIADEALSTPHNPNHAFATGGIATKLKAAKFLLDRNREMFLASGFDLTDIRSYLLHDEHKNGTLFKGKAS